MNCDGGGVPRTTSGIDQEDGSSNTSHRPSMSRGDSLSRFRINILASTFGKSVSRPQISTGAHMRGWSKSLLRLCARAICPSGGCGWKLNQIKGEKTCAEETGGTDDARVPRLTRAWVPSLDGTSHASRNCTSTPVQYKYVHDHVYDPGSHVPCHYIGLRASTVGQRMMARLSAERT